MGKIRKILKKIAHSKDRRLKAPVSSKIVKGHQPPSRHYTIKGNPEEQGFRAFR